jgi:hypothetical protein
MDSFGLQSLPSFCLMVDDIAWLYRPGEPWNHGMNIHITDFAWWWCEIALMACPLSVFSFSFQKFEVVTAIYGQTTNNYTISNKGILFVVNQKRLCGIFLKK